MCVRSEEVKCHSSLATCAPIILLYLPSLDLSTLPLIRTFYPGEDEGGAGRGGERRVLRIRSELPLTFCISF